MPIAFIAAFALLQAIPDGVVVGLDPVQGPMPGTNATLETPHWGTVQEKRCLRQAGERAARENRRVSLAEQRYCATGGAPAPAKPAT